MEIPRVGIVNAVENKLDQIKSNLLPRRPLRSSLAVVTALVLAGAVLGTACTDEIERPSPIIQTTPQPQETTLEEVMAYCAQPRVYDDFAPFGYRVSEYPTREVRPFSQEPVNNNIIIHFKDGHANWLTTDQSFNEIFATLSPDGQRVVFKREGTHRLPDVQGGYATREYTGQEGLYVIGIDGSGKRRLTTPANYELDDDMPTWSPDGSRIAFIRDGALTAPYFSDLYTINIKGSELTRLTNNEGTDNRLFHPQFSPDGRRIAFNNWSSTYVIDADGGNLRRVSAGVHTDAPEGRDVYFQWMHNNFNLMVTRQYSLSEQEALVRNEFFRERRFLTNATGSQFTDITDVCPTPLS